MHMSDGEFEDDDRPRPKKRPREDDDNDERADDDAPRRRKSRRRAADEDDGGVATVIPYRNGLALAAYYCAVFGLIPCFIGLGIFGAVPLILGILGLRKASSDPNARGTGHAWVGIILGGIELLFGCGAVGFVIFTMFNPPR
jgi:Domain of unknown function (DUF4190)